MRFISVLIASLLLVSACEEPLNIEPQQSLPIDVPLSTLEGLEAAVIGGYNALQDVDLGEGNLVIFPDIYADNVRFVGSFPSVQDIATQQVTALNAEVIALYGDGYTVVNQANLILNALSGDQIEATEDDAVDISRIRGEALFLRGLAYFEMVRWFGQPFGLGSDEAQSGLVIRTEPVLSPDDISAVPRNTVAEVYTQVVDDFTAAAEALPESNLDGRADSFAALAYLAKARFQQQNYAEVVRLTGEVIAGPFALTENADGFFRNEFSEESIWELSSVAVDANSNIHITEYTNRTLRDGDVRPSANLINNGYAAIITPSMQAALAAAGLEASDQRVSLLLQDSDGNPASLSDLSSLEHPFKYEDAANNADNGLSVRLAEILLMRAEALLRANGSGSTAEALSLLNRVRLRSLRVTTPEGDAEDAAPFVSYRSSDFGSADALIEAIITERRVELAFEGDRYHDLARLRRPTRSGGPAPGDNTFIFPIPQRAINANDQLSQNPGY